MTNGKYTQQFLDECKARGEDPDEVSAGIDAMEWVLCEMARQHPLRPGPPVIFINGEAWPSRTQAEMKDPYFECEEEAIITEVNLKLQSGG